MSFFLGFQYGELAQLGEHLLCTQGVKGSIPLFSTMRAIPQNAPRKLNNVYHKNENERQIEKKLSDRE